MKVLTTRHFIDLAHGNAPRKPHTLLTVSDERGSELVKKNFAIKVEEEIDLTGPADPEEEKTEETEEKAEDLEPEEEIIEVDAEAETEEEKPKGKGKGRGAKK